MNIVILLTIKIMQLAKGSWQLAKGSWQRAVGSWQWQLAKGSWQLAVGKGQLAAVRGRLPAAGDKISAKICEKEKRKEVSRRVAQIISQSHSEKRVSR